MKQGKKVFSLEEGEEEQGLDDSKKKKMPI